MKKLLTFLLALVTATAIAQTPGDIATFRKKAGTGDDKTYTTPINNAFWGNNGAGAYTQYTANTASTLLDGATDPFLRTSAAGAGGITQLTSDVTAGPGSGSQAATIANDAVTNAKAANMVQATIKGRAAAAGTGDPTDLTPNQVSSILDGATDPFVRTSASSGFVTSVGGTTPINSSGGATPVISIDNAAADGTTKGAASFAAADFNASSGNITIDYTNTQKATGAQPGALTAADWTTFNNKQAAGNYITALTGDGTASGPGSAAFTLATVNGNVGSFGSATQSLSLTANAKGLITAVSAQTVTPAVGSITGLGTGMATWLATPSSANLRSTVTDETGTGALVFADGAIGAATATTAAQGTNTTQVATTAFVQQDAIVKTFVAAKGDIIGASANDTPAITSVGSDGQVLVANSANASGLGYAYRTYTIRLIASSTNLTNIPAAIDWLAGSSPTVRQNLFSLAGYTQVRIMVQATTIFGGAGSGVCLRYRSTYSATASDYSQLGTGATEVLSPISATDWNDSGWITITAAALADVYVGLFTINGNGTSDPVISQVIMYLR